MDLLIKKLLKIQQGDETAMHVAIYVRVSTTSQALKGTSLDSQITLCKNKAKEIGYLDSHILLYKEAGASGEDIDIRPEMTRLREDIKKGEISKLLFNILIGLVVN